MRIETVRLVSIGRERAGVASDHPVGCGLKQHTFIVSPLGMSLIRPPGRMRIETLARLALYLRSQGLIRPPGRMRIETKRQR